jgi:hypothetical protein
MRGFELNWAIRVLPLVLLLFLFANVASAAVPEVSVQPESTFITTGIDTQFSVDLWIDNNAVNLRGFQAFLHYDKNFLKLDTIVEGPLLPSGGTTFFRWYYQGDSSVIRIEDMILGYNLSVNGPGILVTLTFTCKSLGTTYLVLDSLLLKDVNNNTISSSKKGGVVFINTAPSQFNLTAPLNQTTLYLCPTETLTFQWEESFTPYPSDSILFSLSYGTSLVFNLDSTTVLNDLNQTNWKVTASQFADSATIYWKVRAYNIYNFWSWSSQIDWRFLIRTSRSPSNFNLLSPVQDSIHIGNLPLKLNWEDALSPCIGQTIRYALWYSTSPNYPQDSTWVEPNLTSSEYDFIVDTFSVDTQIFWKIRAYDTNNVAKWSNQTDWWFQLRSFLCGDVNLDITVDIGDVVYLINYVFYDGPPPPIYSNGDVNLDQIIDIGDIVYLINYVFYGGPKPCGG